MKLFKKFSKKKPIYNIMEVDFSKGELVNFPDAIAGMTNHRINGMLIRNFLTPETTASLINGFERLTHSDLIEAEKGFAIYPTPFAVFSHLSKENVEQHQRELLKSESIWKDFPINFGFDFQQHLMNCLAEMSGKRAISTVPGENGIGHYHPAGFKRLSPNQGKFTVHCGNYFHDEFSNFFNYLKTLVPIEKQLSYFVTLQSSLEGGELILYDVKWGQAQERLHDGTIIKTLDGKELDISDEAQLKRMVLKPNSGDLFIFASADLWHKVTVPAGSARYTLGGFLGISKDDKSVYMWS